MFRRATRLNLIVMPLASERRKERMQTTGYINLGREKIKILIRPNFHGKYVSIKKRESGKMGREFTDESSFLKERPDLVAQLQAGNVVKL